ncbi:MAG: endolytic transglycosylase MltG [Candidatus Magasanikbacteria bacterium]|nr:endolytic transglycosylase MltG [Candidatus Magasanikbacteria bacterium]
MELFFQKYKFLLVPAVLAVFLFGGLFFYYQRSHPKKVAIPPRPEVTLTIIPGWNLRQVADYLVEKGLASSTQAVYDITGEPTKKFDTKEQLNFWPETVVTHMKPYGLSMEGYLAPETIRVFADADLADGVIRKFELEREIELEKILPDIQAADIEGTKKTLHQILTMASIVEKEVKHDSDRAIVADILWRRLQKGWALQVDSSVHYAVDKTGNVYTTAKDRQVDSAWNTYKYPGLPPGPICNPSIESIKAAIYPVKNDYWYFLSDTDGNMHYAKTLDEHNQNKYKYLR